MISGYTRPLRVAARLGLRGLVASGFSGEGSAMTTGSSGPIFRPFNDSYLLGYSAEHVAYEVDMFLALVDWRARNLTVGAPTAADVNRMNNLIIEGFAIHLRNIIEFLYQDNPKRTDVVAADFLPSGAWRGLLPVISSTLEAARVRANKEIAHLTTDRMAGRQPAKAWDSQGLADEIRPLLRLFVANALTTRLSPAVAAAIR